MTFKWPAEQLDDLLRGRTAWEAAHPAIRSWARLTIHKAACKVLEAPTRERRAAMLAKIPQTIRPHVEAEARRLFSRRREGA